MLRQYLCLSSFYEAVHHLQLYCDSYCLSSGRRSTQIASGDCSEAVMEVWDMLKLPPCKPRHIFAREKCYRRDARLLVSFVVVLDRSRQARGQHCASCKRKVRFEFSATAAAAAAAAATTAATCQHREYCSSCERGGVRGYVACSFRPVIVTTVVVFTTSTSRGRGTVECKCSSSISRRAT